MDGQAYEPLSRQRRGGGTHVPGQSARARGDHGAGAPADNHRPQVGRQVHLPALLWDGGRQLHHSRVKGRRARTSRMVSQYPRQSGCRRASRDQEAEGAGANGDGGRTRATLDEGAPVLAALCRLCAQDRPRDTGSRPGPRSLSLEGQPGAQMTDKQHPEWMGKNRKLTPAEVKDFLAEPVVARIATIDENGVPYVTPVW